MWCGMGLYDYTFDGFPYPEQLVLVFEPPPTPPTNLSNRLPHYAGLKLEKNSLKCPEIQPSAIHKVSYLRI